ncbi:uncharacterized protein LOC125649957 isoform X2 [Ostrea edulis]|uniref:uncharacterized protein LOC125649957 isoform X2 n=1 Tax=Ostrea edulis TaxID=37623 RepID=UPI002095BD73|nr:uncharacterized protein LOC125649957 isoform X2 [Ostrea edulis]
MVKVNNYIMFKLHVLLIGISCLGVLGAPTMPYNPAMYEGLNIPVYNPNAIPFVNYNPMNEQKPRPFSEFKDITTSAQQFLNMKSLAYSGNLQQNMVTPSPFDMNGAKFNPNNGNFMRGFDPNSFAMQPFQEVLVTESPAGHNWNGGWPGKKVSKPSKETVVEKGDDFGNSKDDKIVSISAKSWDGSWPGGDVQEFSSQATDSWNAAVGTKQNNKWQDKSGDFSNKATDSWNKALNNGENQDTKNSKQEDVDEIIQSLMAALEKLQS